MEENFAPYAPTKAVMEAINRYRDRGLPEPLDARGLEQIGVAASMTPRTLQALKFLGLIGDDGMPTEAFKRLKRATSEEYQDQLAEVVRAAYLPIFSIVNPAEDGDIAVADAFRRYEPSNQREKMISLFRGLCGEAGIIEAKARHRSGGPRRPAASRRQKEEKNEAAEQPPVLPAGEGGGGGTDLGLVTAVIKQLPRSGRWSPARREKWLQTITAAVDLLFEVEDDEGGEP